MLNRLVRCRLWKVKYKVCLEIIHPFTLRLKEQALHSRDKRKNPCIRKRRKEEKISIYKWPHMNFRYSLCHCKCDGDVTIATFNKMHADADTVISLLIGWQVIWRLRIQEYR